MRQTMDGAAFARMIVSASAAIEQKKQKINELESSLAQKEGELQQAMKTIEELNAKCDNMLTARVVSVNEGEMKSARMRLSKLVREVDKCIALLNE